MIRRVALIRLRREYRTDALRAQIAAHSRQALSSFAATAELEVRVCADDRTAREWDLCILSRWPDREAVERFRVDPVHRAYSDRYLHPLREAIHVFHFVEPPGDTAAR